MANKSTYLKHLFGGGWASDYGTVFESGPDQSGNMVLPFLLEAENVIFELDGGPHKVPGSAKLNSSALESGATVKGLFDFWLSGTSGSSTQHRVIHVGTKIKKDDADGTFTDLFTGMTSGSIPSYSVLNDILIMSNEDDAPKSWDGTTAQNLAGTPPAFSFSVTHKARAFAAGVAANPSLLYYSVGEDSEEGS